MIQKELRNRIPRILSSNSLQVKSIFLFLGRIGGFAVNFAIPIILVRTITKEEFGYFQQFNLIYTTSVIIFTLWLNSSIYYFFPKSSKQEKSQYIVAITLMEVLMWAVLSVLFFVFKSQILAYFSITSVEQYSWIILLTILFLFISALLDYLFIVEDKKLHNLIFFPVDRLLKGGLIIVLVSYFSIIGILFSFFVYALLRFLFTFGLLMKYIRTFKFQGLRKTKKILRSLLVYSLPFGVGLIAQNIALRIDQFILIDHVSTSEFAMYSIAFYGIPIINFILSSINNVAMPEFTSLSKSKDYEGVKYLWRRIIQKTTSVVIPALGFFILFAPEIIKILFTEEYLDSVLYYRIYLFTVLFSATSYGLILRATNNTKSVMISNLFGLVITVVLGFVLIPEYKMIGAILTAIVAYFVPVAMQLFFEFRLLKVSAFEVFPMRSIWANLLISTIGLLGCLVFKWYINNIILVLLLSLFLFTIIVVIGQYKMNTFILQKELSKFLNRKRNR